ncbi:MAG: S8 family serine peptidase [Alistipes sp.]|nr:S8 family serine peptidase [Alistipes sp.]
MKRLAFASLLILLCTGCADDPAESAAPGHDSPSMHESSVIPGIFRIKLREGAGELSSGPFTRSGAGIAAVDEAATRAGATEIRNLFADSERFRERHRKAGLHLWYEVRFGGDVPVAEAMTRFGAPDEVEVMEPVYRMVPVETSAAAQQTLASTALAAPFDDPMLDLQWVYRNDGTLPGSIAGADLNVYPAWTLCGGSSDVIVAVADGGIDFGHPDLAANMWDDGEGHCGFNFCTDSNEITPSEHGTRVAGMIGAVNGNGIGVCGIAGGDGTPGSGVKLMSCQIFADAPDAHSASIEALMVWAADHGAVISQNSWNYVGLSDLSASGKAAIDYFIEYAGMDENGIQTGPMAGGIVIFAAGNGNTSTPQYPAAYEKVIAVGSLCSDFRKAATSNYGEWVDLVAFGGESTGSDGRNCPFTTDLGGGYIYASGTSMACPQVSGIAALAAAHYGSKRPGFTAAMLREMLIASGRREMAERCNPGYEGAFGAGLVDCEYLFFHNEAPEPVRDATAVGRRYRIEG